MSRHNTFLFLHAHPDDEAIFTGGTLARLTAAGHRCIVVFATSGELGQGAPKSLGERRRAEARQACDVLGVARVVTLGYVDSGLDHALTDQPWGSFASVQVELVADHIAQLLINESADAIITYDRRGVYGHPDHIHAHHVAHRAAVLAGVRTVYDATLDREYLHFVSSHVAEAAGRSIPGRDQVAEVGSSTLDINLTVDVRPVLTAKYRAIAAHRSQVGNDPTLGSNHEFSDVYGWEWYTRTGPRTALDELNYTTAERSLAERRAWVALG